MLQCYNAPVVTIKTTNNNDSNVCYKSANTNSTIEVILVTANDSFLWWISLALSLTLVLLE